MILYRKEKKKKENKTENVSVNLVMNLITTFSQFLFPLITIPYITRVLGAAELGRVNFAISLTSYFAMFAGLGMDVYGVRVCATVRSNRNELSKKTSELMTICIGALSFAMIIYCSLILLVPKFRSDIILYLVVSINLVLTVVGAQWLYQALEKYRYIAVRNLIMKSISVVFIFMTVKAPEDYLYYAISSVITSSGANLLNIISLHKFIDFKAVKIIDVAHHIKPLMMFSAATIANSIYGYLDTVMLGIISGNAETGYYTVGLKVSKLLMQVVVALGIVVMPRISNLRGTGHHREADALITKALNYVFVTAIPILFFGFINASDIIEIVAGNGYGPSIWVLRASIIIILAVGLSNVFAYQILVPYGKEKIVTIAIICGAVIDFVLNIPFAFIGGAVGVAISTAITECSVMLIELLYLRKTIGIYFEGVSGKSIVLKILVCLISAYGLSLYSWSGNTILNMLIQGVTFVGIYLVFLILTKDVIFMYFVDNLKNKIGRRK